jgi:hypothetical protein
MKEDTSLLYFGANLEEFMRCLERREGINDYFASLTTSRYTYENNEFNFHEEMMIENILFLMEEEKIIFLQMGVPDYMTTHTEKEIFYDAHALCIIMVPSKDCVSLWFHPKMDTTVITLIHMVIPSIRKIITSLLSRENALEK